MEATRSKVTTYLDVLSIYSDADVEAACRAMMRRASAFPPSAGELRAECERVVMATRPAPFSSDRNLPPPDKRTDEEKAASRARVAKMYAEWRAGLPASEASLAKAVGGVMGLSGNRPASDGPVTVSGSLMERLSDMGLVRPEDASGQDDAAF